MDYDQLCVVFDLETTGFRGLPIFSSMNRIIQIACKDITNRYPPFAFFVDPDMQDIPPMSSAVNHILKEQVTGCKSFSVVFQEMLNHFEIEKWRSVRMISHNGTFFDEPVLRRHVNNRIPINIHFFDSLPFMRNNYPELKTYTLTDLYKTFYGTVFDSSHRADADVNALVRLYNDYIHPKLLDGTAVSVKKKDLKSIKYISYYRSRVILETLHGVQTVEHLREYFSTSIGSFDSFMREILNMNDISHRMSIVLELYGYERMYREVTAPIALEGSMNEVEYYVRCRYGKGSDKPLTKNNVLYQRGLLQLHCT